MNELNAQYQELFDEVRRTHNRLRWVGDVLHEKDGVSTATRSLLYSIHREGPLTVPELARERLVSRQIIQTQINLLLEMKLVKAQVNPNHRRSKHMVLTTKGEKLVAGMLKKEASLLASLGAPLSSQEVLQTIAGLQALRGHLETHAAEIESA